jgi:hypothetical protein
LAAADQLVCAHTLKKARAAAAAAVVVEKLLSLVVCCQSHASWQCQALMTGKERGSCATGADALEAGRLWHYPFQCLAQSQRPGLDAW